jgi:restriction system protein
VFGGRARHDRRVEEARAEFDDALAAYDRAETTRQRWVREARTRHRLALEKHTAGVAEHNQAIGALRAGLASRDRESVEAYLEMVLARTPLPHDVPHQAEVAYSPRGEQAVVRFELPPADVVPAIANYTFVGTSGELREKKRPDAESRRLYRSIVSQIALLYMRDLLEADLELENVELGGHVHAINPATGQLRVSLLDQLRGRSGAISDPEPARRNLRKVSDPLERVGIEASARRRAGHARSRL